MAKLRIAKWEAKEGNTLTANGLIRVNPNKPEFGSLMLISTSLKLSNSFANVRPKVGFIVGRVTELEGMINEYNLKAGDDFSAKVGEPHKIVTLEKVESEIPENQGYRPKINPTTGEHLTKDGEPIYWKTEVVAEGSDVHDVYLQHDTDKVDQSISEFQNAEVVKNNK